MNHDIYYFTLHMPDPAAARDFFEALFGWKLRESGPGSFHIENASPPGGIAPGSIDESPTIYIHHPDPYAAVTTVRANGGQAEDVEEARSGPYAKCLAPGGAHFSLGRLRPDLAAEEVPEAPAVLGNLGYLTIPAPDLEEATAFYNAVFGWEYSEVSGTYAHVPSLRPAGGLVVSDAKYPQLWFRVSDTPAMLRRVTELGGTAGEASASESGVSADCTGPQGLRFSLWQPAEGL